MKNIIKAAAMTATCLGITVMALADPRPGAEPPKAGEYGTDWGKAQFEFDARRSVNGTFRFADGHVIYGTMSGGGGTPWRLTGAYVLKPIGHGGVPRSMASFARCATEKRYRSDFVEIPDSRYWGNFEITFNTSGTHIIGNAFSPCVEGGTARAPTGYSPPELNGSYQPTTYTLAPIVLPPPGVVKSKRYDGPCNSVSRVAIARITPCSLPAGGGFTLKLTKNARNPIRAVVLTPLSDNWIEVGSALQEDRVPPHHPTGTPIVVEVTGTRPFRIGDSTVITPPPSVCAHVLWAVTLRDETDNYPNHGFLLAECGRRAVVPGAVEK